MRPVARSRRDLVTASMMGAFIQSDLTDFPLSFIGSPTNNLNVSKDYQDDCETYVGARDRDHSKFAIGGVRAIEPGD